MSLPEIVAKHWVCGGGVKISVVFWKLDVSDCVLGSCDIFKRVEDHVFLLLNSFMLMSKIKSWLSLFLPSSLLSGRNIAQRYVRCCSNSLPNNTALVRPGTTESITNHNGWNTTPMKTLHLATVPVPELVNLEYRTFLAGSMNLPRITQRGSSCTSSIHHQYTSTFAW